MIPEETVSRIRDAVDIVEIVSESVILKRTGKHFSGLCPFHSEKAPSFSVSPDRQMFHCFGCGEGGNVFSFLMKRDGVSFPEAVRILSARCGIEITDERMDPAELERIARREKILALNAEAADCFRRALAGPTGDRARAYLRDRGLTEDTLEAFSVGYATPGWDGLLRYFRGRAIAPADLEAAGLVAPRRDASGFYDRFRDRIILPIIDSRRQVIGFGGRVLDDALPKYINSPETPVFNKSRTLYGLHRTRSFCRSEDVVFLVEGYFDVVMLYQRGIRNCVATLGTALTTEHARLLRGLARSVVLLFDSDAAGIKAAGRSVPIFTEAQMDARVLVLPEGHDPDTYLRAHGADAFKKLAESAVGMIPFLMDTAIARHGLSVEGRLRVIEEMEGPINAVSDGVARSLYLKELAERARVDEGQILLRYKNAPPRRAGRNGPPMDAGNAGSIEPLAYSETSRYAAEYNGGYNAGYNAGYNGGYNGGYSGPSGGPTARRPYDGAAPPVHKTPVHRKPVLKKPVLKQNDKPDRLERKIIAMMLQYPEMIPEINARKVIARFRNRPLRRIGRAILADADPRPATVPDSLASDPELSRLAAGLAMGEERWGEKDCMRLLDQFDFRRQPRHHDLMERIRAAESRNDNAALLDLLAERQRLAKRAIGPQSQ